MRNKLSLLITALLLASCWEGNRNTNGEQSAEDGDSAVQAEVLTFSKTGFSKKGKVLDTERPNYTIDIEVKYAEGKSQATELINGRLTTFLFGKSGMPLEEAKKVFADSLCQEYEKELKEFYDPDNEYQDSYEYEYTLKGRLADSAAEGVIAYISRTEMYTGGAHGGAMESYINFWKDSGKMITAKAFFGKNEKAVLKLIKAKIIRENECETEDELIEKRGIFSLGDVYISDSNFLLEKDGVLFCYNPYDIAPWSEGFIFARLSYEELKGLVSFN